MLSTSSTRLRGSGGLAVAGVRAITRRRALALLGGAMVSAALPAQSRNDFPLAPDEDAFLAELERCACLFFYEQADPRTGQVLDRALNRTPTGVLDPRRVTSIAATGFGLTALCIADRRGYLPLVDIRARVRTTLDFHLNRMPHQHGFLSHFNDARTGAPLAGSEFSSIDTSILLCGALTCRTHFADDARIASLVSNLYDRVDFPWMLNGGETFSMGWHPETGFLASRWDRYCELMMLYLLGIGSATHPVEPRCWDRIVRPRTSYGAFVYISDEDPLFVHQFSHAWFDFEGKRDAYADYFRNSVIATEAHKAFCLGLGRGYTDDYWGVTASDWEHGYTAWGGPPLMGPVNGAVVPCASAGSLPFLPEECLNVLRALKRDFGQQAWGRYGFADAFHPALGWYDPDVVGIDLGITALMAENLRSRFVWDTFMRNPETQVAMGRVGFHAQ